MGRVQEVIPYIKNITLAGIQTADNIVITIFWK